ncbi:MAG: HD domain-containing protein [Leadbetterella sp.]
MNTLEQQIQFIIEIDKLKSVFRKTSLFYSSRKENSAEHSWHLCLMAMVLAPYSDKPVDISLVLKMLLIHDLVEIDAGDTFFFDEKNRDAIKPDESQAAERIFGMLPEEQKNEFYALWKEFEDKKTPDSLFANAVDMLEPMLQNMTNQGGTWVEFSVTKEKVLRMKSGIRYSSQALWDYVLTILDKAENEGFFSKN